MGYVEGQDAVLLADQAAVREGLAQARVAVAQTMAEAHDFFTSNGQSVVAGHADVNAAGRQGDPDPTLDAADA